MTETFLLKELTLNYGTAGIIIAVLLLVVFRLDVRLASREKKEDEFRDSLVKIVESNTKAMTELALIIKSRKE